jgi:hypothetical protein
MWHIWGVQKCTQNFSQNGNIKLDLEETVSESVECIHMAQDTDHVNMVP